MASSTINPAAPHHLPGFISAPGESDFLLSFTIGLLVVAVLMIGVLYLRLHALPEHIAHRTTKVQYEVVAVLALLALFTHNHLYWIAGLLLAMVQLPDFSTPLTRMADSLARMAGAKEQASAAIAPITPQPPQPLPIKIDAQLTAQTVEAKDPGHA